MNSNSNNLGSKWMFHNKQQWQRRRQCLENFLLYGYKQVFWRYTWRQYKGHWNEIPEESKESNKGRPQIYPKLGKIWTNSAKYSEKQAIICMF